ncbi:hypothetical protein N7493_011418 [Penicillium malachiteum]|uniref:FYVE-type domain-containing protein n=1 Tax=Penicillium malachiteum TaxID=1324776 RepID=A0AAD6HC35_9EURO|nr:hypothetical protein N7493_011418 [Penicillium malachiteum]
MTTTPNQISVYGHPSPTHSTTTTPSNNSPTSPRLATAHLHQLPLQSRQLRPLKGPLYVPAALRPTERPQKSSPITPPRSVHGSLDSLSEDTAEPISRRSTMESKSSSISKDAEEEWMRTEQLGEVTGEPTHAHWKDNKDSDSCDSPDCRSSFGIFVRRHHCRHCGHIFCASHSNKQVPLDQDAQFRPDGKLYRVCNLCQSAYKAWGKTRADRLNQIQNNIDARSIDEHSNPEDLENSQESGRAALQPNLGQTPDVAASVPRDWSWSTF